MGLKTTFGLVGKASCVPCAWSFDTFGPLALTAEDCALAMTAMAGYEPADPCSVNRPASDFIGALGRPLKGFRIGHARSFYADRAEPFITKAVDEAARAFANAGAEVTEIEIPQYEQVFEAAIHILMSEVAAFHEKHIRERPGDIGPLRRGADANGVFRAGPPPTSKPSGSAPSGPNSSSGRFTARWTDCFLRRCRWPHPGGMQTRSPFWERKSTRGSASPGSADWRTSRGGPPPVFRWDSARRGSRWAPS